MIDVKETLERLQSQRKDIVPKGVLYVALCNDVIRQMRDELNALYSNGEIKVEKTLNDSIITLS